MKTVFSKILLAQVVAVVLALLIVTVITRVSLNRGFKDFLEMQEANVLQNLVPELAESYDSRGSWDFLRNNPRSWQHVLRLSRPPQGDSAQSGRRPPPRQRSTDRVRLRERLFLLDENHVRIAGAEVNTEATASLEPIESNGRVVGWIGFIPMGNVLPPEAQRFLGGQIRITVISLLLALLVAAGLAFVLARNVSRPVRQLGDTVRKLSEGEYLASTGIESRDEIGSLASNVDQLATTLEKNRTARQRWMADIAHELRTPVAILKGEVEALVDGVRPADERMSLSLREEIDHLAALVDDLQTLALSDAGALNISKEPVDLSGLTRQCVTAFEDRLAERGIKVGVVAGESVILTADQRRLRQLLHNLLENCSRYVVQDGEVRVLLEYQAGGVLLTLEDSGPGLDDEQLSRLFDRFYRVEVSRSRSSGGSGLGLSICRNIVEAHDGRIEATHSPLGGLRISVMLPA
jgi:two-component system sensor histidine kinase BaeS